MLKSLGTEFKVGLFALVALGALGYMFFVLNPDTFQNKKSKTYYTVLKNAAGIVAKTHVKTSGVSVGKVKSVDLEGATTRIMLEIDHEVKIPVGSRIKVTSVGLLGDKHLEVIRPESDTGEYVEPNGLIPQAEGAVDMESLIELVGDVAKDVKKVTNTLASVLGSKKGEQSVQNIVDNIEGITADVKATTGTLKKVLGDREGDLQDIVTGVRDGVKDLRLFAANLKDVLDDENRERIDRILASFDETMVDVKGSAKNINLISAKVEKGEGTIGRLVNDDSTLAELEGAIKDIRQVLAPATKLAIDVDYHGEARRDESTQHYFNVLFRTRPDRYYLLGLTDTSYDKVETDTQVETTPGEDGDPDTVSTNETIRREKALRFNLQVAKRWHFFTARFGLFESSGGIASDVHLFDDVVRLTVEAFDWDTQDKAVRRNAHLKAYASVLFYNHVYVMGGVDDPTRTDPETGKVTKKVNWFAGAGLTFTDQDLKAIFGTAALAM
jgi:phospholipid/cholesterol/gamma-HCH transport system substrate-binding protein